MKRLKKPFFLINYLPVRDLAFWLIQFMVLLIAALHFVADIANLFSHLPIPNSETVGLLLIPVAYAGIKYGLKGSVGTAVWSVIIWLPDLLLPDDHGEPWADLVELLLVIGVAIFVGIRINKERQAKIDALIAQQRQKGLESRYRILFESNPAPTMLLDSNDIVSFANPSAFKLFGNDIIGKQISKLIRFEDDVFQSDYGATIINDNSEREFRVVKTRLAETEISDFSHQESESNKLGYINHSVSQITMFDVTLQTRLAKMSHDYAISLIKVQEEERKRIALELHDDTIQKLINISQKLQLASYEATEGIRFQLNDIYDSTVYAIGDLRRIATGLRPSILDDFGFAVALKIWIAELVDVDKIKMEITGTPVRLSSDAELNIFRVIQEGISNAVKHAKATQVTVLINFSSDSISVRIKDNGCGFNPNKKMTGMGILGMEERIKMFNGNFTMDSNGQTGTNIQASICITELVKKL